MGHHRKRFRYVYPYGVAYSILLSRQDNKLLNLEFSTDITWEVLLSNVPTRIVRELFPHYATDGSDAMREALRENKLPKKGFTRLIDSRIYRPVSVQLGEFVHGYGIAKAYPTYPHWIVLHVFLDKRLAL